MSLRITYRSLTAGRLVEVTGYTLPTQAHHAAEDLAKRHGYARLDVVYDTSTDADGITTSAVQNLDEYGDL